jgi:hypothetical protein
MGEIYTEDFYDAEWLIARPSVCVIVPLLLELIRPVRSVIDYEIGKLRLQISRLLHCEKSA